MRQVLVHGDSAAMNRLRMSLQQRFKDREEEIKVHTPRNCETVKLTFRGERVAKVPFVPIPLIRCNLHFN